MAKKTADFQKRIEKGAGKYGKPNKTGGPGKRPFGVPQRGKYTPGPRKSK